MNQKKAGEVRIPLLQLATGPNHFDYLVTSMFGNFGRISFDVQMSQVVDFKLNVKNIEYLFLERLKSQFYSFFVKVLVAGPSRLRTAPGRQLHPEQVLEPLRKLLLQHDALDYRARRDAP